MKQLKFCIILYLLILGVGYSFAQNWIKTDGTNYINTGYYPTSNTMVRINFFKHSSTVGKDANNLLGIFGSEKTAANPNGTGLLLGVDGAGHAYIKMGTAYYYLTGDHNMDPGWLYYVTLKNGEYKTSHTGYDGTVRTLQTWTPCPYFSMNVNPIYIGSISGTSRKSYITIYDFIIYENNSAVRHFYPAKWNGVYGLYEAKQNKFYAKATGNNFTGGISTCSSHVWYAIESSSSSTELRHCRICDAKYNVYKMTVTYNANGGDGSVAQHTVTISGNTQANSFRREGFTFAGWNTKADGTGTKYAAGASITPTSTFNGPITLYAQWTAQAIKATFDYTYRTSEQTGVETYENMTNQDAAFTTKVRANFRNASGAVLNTQILTAPTATTPTGTITSNITTHKTAAITLNVVKGSSNALSNSGSTYTLTLNAANYTNYRSVDFEVLNAAGTAVAPHWASSKQDATNYIFKYEGHESGNMFEMGWRVNLKNLSMYPTTVFVKPMRKGETDVQIPAMQNTDGIQCNIAGYIDASGNDVTIADYNNKSDADKAEFNKNGGAYYKGEYNVLKTDAQAQAYNYKVGVTGFILDGIIYYLAPTAGNIPNDMISSAVASSNSSNITYELTDKQIPVLILSPNGSGATVSGRDNYKLYVDNHAARTVNLEQFKAVRPGYTFMGWKDAYDNIEYAYNGDYHFNMGTKATSSLLAQWERTTPLLVENDIVESENDFKYKVEVVDDLNDIKSVKYIFTDNDTQPAADASGWNDMNEKESDDIYTLTIPVLNNYNGKYLWVKAANADKHAIINLGTVSSIYKVKANPDPDSHELEQIENGTWEGETFKPDGTKTTINYYDYYSTFYFGDRTFIANNATVYTAQINGNHLDLTEIMPSVETGHVVIPQHTAVILCKKHDTDGNIVLEECAQSTQVYSDNILKGVDDSTEQSAGYYYYIFSYAQKGLGFYLNSSTTLAAHKAYFKLDNDEQNARAFTLNFGDSETTGIRDIETEADTDALYDLSGRKVSAPSAQGGIYILNGKKVFIKK